MALPSNPGRSTPVNRPEADIPRPLQIIKRPDSRRSHKSYTSRRCSTDSTDSNSSRGSIPEPLGGEQPLTVRKRRGDSIVPATPKATPRPVVRPRRSTSVTDPREVEERTPTYQSPSKTSLLPPRRTPATDRARGASPAPSAATQGRPHLKRLWLRNTKSMLQMAPPPSRPYESAPEPLLPAIDLESPCDSIDSACPPDPFVLVPRIVVTPDTKVLDDRVDNVWAAVQLSTRICRASGQDQAGQGDDKRRPLSFHEEDGSLQSDVFQYGCLYDVKVEVLPTSDSQVIEVVENAACTKILYPGSRVLVMAHVRLILGSSGQRQGHIRQSSEDLIQDLEYHLGTTTVEYLQIRMTYRHSGFPHQIPSATASPGEGLAEPRHSDGVIGIQTRMETTAIAVIQRHNSSSLWSPRPLPQPAPQLFGIIASHWGPEKAHEVISRVNHRSRSPPVPRRPVNFSPSPSLPGSFPDFSEEPSSSKRNSDETLRPLPAPPPTRGAPPIPVRQTSLHRASIPQSVAQHQNVPGLETETSSTTTEEEYDKESDPARKIWTQMRRTSISGGRETRPSYHVSRVRKVPSSATLIPPPTPSSGARGLAVAVRRLPQEEGFAEPVTPPPRRTGNGTISPRKSVGKLGFSETLGRRDTLGRRSIVWEGRAQIPQGSLASPRSEERGDTTPRRPGGVNGNGIMGPRAPGIAVGVGLGAGSRLMANVDNTNGVSHGSHYGVGSVRKETAKDTGK